MLTKNSGSFCFTHFMSPHIRIAGCCNRTTDWN